jgi:type IV pilus assembly protein PilP
MLVACGDKGTSDLEIFIEETIEESKNNKGIPPLEEMGTVDFFYYELGEWRDPFIEMARVEEVIEENIDLPKKITNGIKPDFKRIKEDLESFPLGALQMVGTVKTDQLWGLVRSEEGIQKVKIGNYMGKNHGKIIQISTMEIKLEEIVKENDESEIWLKKEAKLPLDMGVDETK